MKVKKFNFWGGCLMLMFWLATIIASPILLVMLLIIAIAVISIGVVALPSIALMLLIDKVDKRK